MDGCTDGKAARQHHRDGSRGTVRVDTLFDLGYDVEIHEDNTVGGAYGTYGSLRVDGRLRDTGAASERNGATGDKVIEPRISFDGPEFQLARRARPARLSFFVRLDPRNDTQIPRRAGTWGGMVALYDAPDEIPPNTDPWAVGNPSFASRPCSEPVCDSSRCTSSRITSNEWLSASCRASIGGIVCWML